MESTLFSIDTSDQLVYALGWTVLHSLWQGTLLALLVGVSAAFIKKQSAQTRYWTALLGLGGLLFWAAFTFIRIYQLPIPDDLIANNIVIDGTNIIVRPAVQEGTSTWLPFLQYFEMHLPMIVSCWLIGMSIFALRFLGGLAYVQQLKHQYNKPVDAKFKLLINQIQEKIQLKKVVDLVESTKIRVPMTIGHLKPIILLPAGALLALSPAQIEAVLAHELAHIKRNDFLVNLFQSVVEVLFYYHPAVWWLSAQVRMERENCCDDIAVAACGDDLEYAKALLSLQEYSKGSPTFAMAFSNKKNHLLNRVKRILNHPINSNRIMEKFSITALILLCLLVVSMQRGQESYDPALDKTEAILKVEVAETTEPLVSAISIYQVQIDTIPQGKVNLKLTRNGEKIEAKMEKGQIKSLKINGEVQDKSMYDAYLPILEEVMAMPAPPLPPAPPAPGMAPAPPAPPAPGMAPAPPAPPAPGMAPAPPSVIEIKKSIKVKTTEGEDGNTFVIIEEEPGGEPMEIKVSELKGEGKVIFLNGERMENGESMIFADEVEIVEMVPGQQKVHVDGLELMLKYDGTSGKHIAVLDSARAKLATVWVEKATVRQAELEKIQAELARMSEQEGARNESQMKALQAELEAAQKKMQEEEIVLHEALQERLQSQQQVMEESKVKMETELKLIKEESQKVSEMARKQQESQKKMLNEMVKDGLLESTENYKIVISDKSLKINGQKQAQSVFEKYRKIYEEGFESRGGYKVTLKKSNN
ncbi:MAG: hypothetical protein Sapg2KO_40120 [Saprospiraceae bacterium]